MKYNYLILRRSGLPYKYVFSFVLSIIYGVKI